MTQFDLKKSIIIIIVISIIIDVPCQKYSSTYVVMAQSVYSEGSIVNVPTTKLNYHTVPCNSIAGLQKPYMKPTFSIYFLPPMPLETKRFELMAI